MVSTKDFRDISDKFLQSEASIIQLSNSFTQFADEVKLRCDFSKDEDRAADVKISLKSINKFLQCIIEYATCGVANTRSSNLRQLCNKICKAVEDLKIKDEFLEHLSKPTFEFLLGQTTWIAKEILRMYNTAIQNTDINVRSRVINMKGSYYLGRLMDELPFGDIDFQLIIVETLIRLSTKEAMKDMPTVNFQREEHREAFYNIDTNKFDFTARIFLNVLNETENHVVSLLCNRVTFDDYRLQEPHELASFQGLWVDFNVKAGSVTLFINNEVFNKNSGWEMITIFSENIAKNDVSYMFNEESKKREGVAKILLKGPCQMIYADAQHQLHNCRLLTVHSLDTEKFKEVFNQAFPKIHKRIKQKQARSSPLKVDDSVDLSMINYKIKKTNENIMKRHSNSHDISSCSNLSVLEQIKTGKDAEIAVASKKMNIEKVEINDTFKTTRICKYSQEFLSRLVDIEENDNATLERTGATNSNLQKNSNATTLMGGLYSNVNKSKTKRSNQKKVPFAFREITNSALIDRDRDCQIDAFDLLKLERPKNLRIESQNDEVSTEPSLIQISKSKYPSFETEMFETARTQLGHEEASEIELTDIECSAGSSQKRSTDTDESQPAEPVFSKPSKILAEADQNMNVTLNTTNSMISSNVRMLKRGRKLYNQDDERENFMNFTIAQGEIENMVSVQKPMELKILNTNPNLEKRKTDNIKKPKELRSVMEDHGKTKLEKSIKLRNADKRDKTKLDKIKNTLNENGLKGNSTERKSTRKERLDAFYDRVIAKLQTPRNQSRSPYSVIPKVRNEDEEKYKLDFSWVQEIIQNKKKTVDPNSNFSNHQNTHREIIAQPSTSKDKGDGNVILENQDGEYDDDVIKSVMKCFVDRFQKMAEDTLTKPSPVMKKHLIATATYWMDVMKNAS